MERYVPFTSGEFYHLYNRGIDKRKIFFSDGDWRHFQRLLYIRNDADGQIRPERVHKKPLRQLDIKQPLVHLQAYALMPNHFHLLLIEAVPNGISTYMRKLLTSYSMYMNKKYERSGPLMCRPFRARHIDSDEYMRYVISYIHLKPLDLHDSDWKERGVRDPHSAQHFLSSYNYCSYRDYFGTDRDESVIINKESLPFFITDLEGPSAMFAHLATT